MRFNGCKELVDPQMKDILEVQSKIIIILFSTGSFLKSNGVAPAYIRSEFNLNLFI